MKFAIISGSTRQNNPQSRKVSKYIDKRLTTVFGEDTYLLDLSVANIKFWDETFWSDYDNFDKNWTKVSQELHKSDALIIVAPEWNGMLPPALKNVFHLAVKGEFANKPALIVGVTSGIGGVYPVSELRLNSHKNTFINYIPQHVIVRNVLEVLNELEAVNKNDAEIRKRLDHSLHILNIYAKNFIAIRKSSIINSNDYPFGM